MKFLIPFVTSLLLIKSCIANDVMSTKDAKGPQVKKPLGAIQRLTPDKDMVLGSLLEQHLENIHFTHKKVNDSLSKQAYKLYLERIDYGKQFLIESDLEKFEKYEEKFDDQLKLGDLSIISLTEQVMSERIPLLSKHVQAILKKGFDFSKVEKYETDPKKREFVDSIDELKERWRKMIKYEVINQYLELKDDDEGLNDDDEDKNKKVAKKKSKKKKKKKSYDELMAESKKKVGKRYKKVFKRYLEEKRSDQLDKFYNAITRVYDPHTMYLVPEEKEDFDIDMSGKLEGIGALLREEGSYIKVERIIPGSASWRGKELKAEDIILAVGQGDKEFVDIVDMSIRDAVKLIRGKKGTIVRLKVKRPDGTTKIIPITRDKVVLEEAYVKSTVLEHKDLKQKIGYIHVPKFYRDFQDPNGRNSSTDVKREILKLKKLGVQGIILNLRNNGGGALRDATLMGGLFIDKGPIVQVKNRERPQALVEKDTDGKTYWEKPLIVLVNRFSASASEIVAGALKDYKRAVIVGSSEQTHGKGTVQAVLGLNEYLNPFTAKFIGPIGAMKITTDMFYRINGMSTQFRGIRPHITLPDEYGFLESGEQSLDYAIPYGEVAPLKYKVWDKQKYNIKKLQAKSVRRVAKNDAFQKIIASVNWSKQRKDQSERVIGIKELEDFRKEAREVSEKYKVDTINESIKVVNTKKPKSELEKESFKEFKEQLQKDPVIEETLLIFNDMLNVKS